MLEIPWRAAGLTQEQAAAHLLDRCTFGASRQEINRIVSVGLESWLEEQLAAKQESEILNKKLSAYSTLTMSSDQIASTYPTPGKVILELLRDGKLKSIGEIQDTNNKEFRKTALAYAYKNGYKPIKQLYGEFIAAKILRATYSPNQLSELLADFWFNHFSVSGTKGQAATYVPSYERDAIRPNVLGSFESLVMATAKHPAMLQYLDNAQSTAPDGTPTLLSIYIDSLRNIGGIKGWIIRKKIDAGLEKAEELKQANFKNLPAEFVPKKGINENYARELLELHTLGVNGGYTQKDVTEAARVLTGWTMFPIGYSNAPRYEKILTLIEKTEKAGTLRQGDFLFRADAHDATEKTVLGKTFAANRGLEEGEELLRMLCNHPSTAQHIATKLCRKFISDTPPQTIIDKVAATFISSRGSIASMIRTIAYSPEFWSADARRSKIKKPFELVISSLRATEADVTPSKQLYDWITRLGEKLYAAQAPTGYPDKAVAWVNSGSLINRMNFGIALANNTIKGIRISPLQLTNNHEPESATDALRVFIAILLPGRDNERTVQLLQSAVMSPNYTSALQKQSKKPTSQESHMTTDEEMENELDMFMDSDDSAVNKQQPDILASVIGIILGSPEFQRR
ncbi:MAG: DUF1800 domain-containing protein [Candidatus Kapabacteria bacterium]|nr:DUF1800 domain-containing protein [Candidatus Kapabacteria bacterium]